MTFDGLTLAAMAAELNRAILGGRVQKAVQPDPVTVALEIYAQQQRSWLVLSADPQRPRVYLAADRPGRGVETPTPLLLLLRKHAVGRRVDRISQPPGERILVFDLAAPWGADDSDSGDHPAGVLRLIIEAISQYSNLILVDDRGLVLDAARRVSAEQNRFRVTLPHQPYTPPPAQSKRSLDGVDAEQLRRVLAAAESGSAVWQVLVAAFAGLGPLAGRELTYRAFSDARARVPADEPALAAAAALLADAFQSVVEPVRAGSFPPSVALDGETIVAFAPYALTHLGRWEPRATLSAAADDFYRQTRSVGALDLARRAVHAALAAERVLAEKKRDSLLRGLEAAARAEDLRHKGELLLTYAAAIPRGAASFRADGVTLELDPRATAVENAQATFRRYAKAKSALREVPALLDETSLRLRYLDEVAGLVDLAETPEDLRALRAEIRPGRERPQPPTRKQHARRRAARRPEQGILRLRTKDGAEVLVGRSAQQNHFVTFELARPQDIWLHARGSPGAHVILRVGDGPPSRAALEEAARLAARYSASRAAGRVTVDWTPRKFVRRLGKGTPGLVSYSNEQSLVVRPDPVMSDE